MEERGFAVVARSLDHKLALRDGLFAGGARFTVSRASPHAGNGLPLETTIIEFVANEETEGRVLHGAAFRGVYKPGRRGMARFTMAEASLRRRQPSGSGCRRA